MKLFKPYLVWLTLLFQEIANVSVFRCDTCDCTCTSSKQLREHMAGAKHKQIALSLIHI